MPCNNCNLNTAIDIDCLPCFTRCLMDGTQTDTIIKCVKKNNLEMFKCAMESEHLTKPSDYEIATHAIQHNGEAWYPYILRAVSESSNPRRIALFKLAIKSGDINLCSQMYPYLKPRTTNDATRKDMVDFMECAVFSLRLGMIMWVERTFNPGSTVWPGAWMNNGRRLVEMIFKNKKYYTRFHMVMDTFRHVIDRIVVHCWDTAAKIILSYDNPDNANTWSLFNHFWFIGGSVNASCGWKNYCIRYNKIEEMGMIHSVCPEWPVNFFEECDSIRGARQWGRRNLKDWAVTHGFDAERIQERAAQVEVNEERVTNLQKALAVIEECDIPEGKYLELCNLLMDVHKRGVVA
jgi:hypothetical protein